MDYLVTMTTHVPEGTSEQAVDDVRRREAARSRELAAEKHLLRLWRPPLEPGEWRTLGLFAAEDSTQLEKILASMPLRIWRADEVTTLSPHPNDPGAPMTGERGEFLVTFAISIPDGTSTEEVDEVREGEQARARELAEQGHLIRLWTLPGLGRALGLWRARDTAELEAIMETLPVAPWTTMEITSLGAHPSDPART